jgi:hypothetical protein
MNWIAGLIAFLLFYIPLMFIFVAWFKANKRAEQDYRESMKAIEKKYWS